MFSKKKTYSDSPEGWSSVDGPAMGEAGLSIAVRAGSSTSVLLSSKEEDMLS